jgi:hypothetical protein
MNPEAISPRNFLDNGTTCESSRTRIPWQNQLPAYFRWPELERARGSRLPYE